MSAEPWVFGVAPLSQSTELAPLLRDVAGLALSMEREDPAVQQLIAVLVTARDELEVLAPTDLAPRIGPEPQESQRVYVDHSRDIGGYNPVFPPYVISVEGPTARGEVVFPLAFEGPPGLVHGGVLATFFDCVVQHHNCDVGVAGKTISLLIEFRRPTPLLRDLRFEIDRAIEDRRIVSQARLFAGDDLLCSAIVRAVAGDRTSLPDVSPRRVGS